MARLSDEIACCATICGGTAAAPPHPTHTGPDTRTVWMTWRAVWTSIGCIKRSYLAEEGARLHVFSPMIRQGGPVPVFFFPLLGRPKTVVAFELAIALTKAH
jgi:hypothetical protein